MIDISSYDEIDKILLSEDEIKSRVSSLGQQITTDYEGIEEPLILIGILKGSVFFLSDLSRQIDLPITFDFMAVSSYGNEATSSGDVRILKDLDQKIEGKHVIIVEDIVDTGYTLSYLMKNLESRGAKSIKIASLLNKPERRIISVDIDYLGFNIPDEFIVGYGIDYAQKYRNLPFIATIKRDIYE